MEGRSFPFFYFWDAKPSWLASVLRFRGDGIYKEKWGDGEVKESSVFVFWILYFYSVTVNYCLIALQLQWFGGGILKWTVFPQGISRHKMLDYWRGQPLSQLLFFLTSNYKQPISFPASLPLPLLPPSLFLKPLPGRVCVRKKQIFPFLKKGRLNHNSTITPRIIFLSQVSSRGTSFSCSQISLPP